MVQVPFHAVRYATFSCLPIHRPLYSYLKINSVENKLIFTIHSSAYERQSQAQKFIIINENSASLEQAKYC